MTLSTPLGLRWAASGLEHTKYLLFKKAAATLQANKKCTRANGKKSVGKKMSTKLSFRARALDPSKPMPIYLAEDLPDIQEYSAINRAVPQMPSGMEKEEESVSASKPYLKKNSTFMIMADTDFY